MAKKLTLEQWKEKATQIYPSQAFCYDNVVYINSSTKVKIKCNTCGGEFFQQAGDHLQGRGCPLCNRHHNRLVTGVGITDIPFTTVKGKKEKSYTTWRNILLRCYNRKQQNKIWGAYKGCKVCEEWLYFSNFKKWFDENYIEGYALDKDILIKGNKVYSPKTCCFVPPRINSLLVNRRNFRGNLPLGVKKKKLANGREVYSSTLLRKDKRIFLGTFNNIKDAFNSYKVAKEAYIQEVAQCYYDKGLIAERVYNALMNYKVEIAD